MSSASYIDVADRQLAQGDVRYGPGLYADQRRRQRLPATGHVAPIRAKRRTARAMMLSWNTLLLSASGDRSNRTTCMSRKPEFSATGDTIWQSLLRLNTSDRHQQAGRAAWPMHAGMAVRPAGRRAHRPDGRRTRKRILYYRDECRRAMAQAARERRVPGGGRDDFSPAFFAPEGNLYVHAASKGATSWPYTATTWPQNRHRGRATGKHARLRFCRHPRAGQQGRLLGLRYETDAAGHGLVRREDAKPCKGQGRMPCCRPRA